MVDVGTDSTVAELGIFAGYWVGSTRTDCTKAGACWVFITNDLVSLCMGFTHTTNAGELPRITDWACVDRTNVLENTPDRGRYIAVWAVIYPLIVWWLCMAGFLVLSGLKPGNGAG